MLTSDFPCFRPYSTFGYLFGTRYESQWIGRSGFSNRIRMDRENPLAKNYFCMDRRVDRLSFLALHEKSRRLGSCGEHPRSYTLV
jgi:hypothetical protein